MIDSQFCILCAYTVATVEMESTIFAVTENAGSVEVCASVNDANGCRVQFAFDVTFSVSGSGISHSLSPNLSLNIGLLYI